MEHAQELTKLIVLRANRRPRYLATADLSLLLPRDHLVDVHSCEISEMPSVVVAKALRDVGDVISDRRPLPVCNGLTRHSGRRPLPAGLHTRFLRLERHR